MHLYKSFGGYIYDFLAPHRISEYSHRLPVPIEKVLDRATQTLLTFVDSLLMCPRFLYSDDVTQAFVTRKGNCRVLSRRSPLRLGELQEFLQFAKVDTVSGHPLRSNVSCWPTCLTFWVALPWTRVMIRGIVTVLKVVSDWRPAHMKSCVLILSPSIYTSLLWSPPRLLLHLG